MRISIRLLVATAILLGTSAHVSAQPKEEPKEPLPQDAAQRLGVSRPILRQGPAVAIVTPACKEFLAPTMQGGVRRYDLETGKPIDKEGVVDAGEVSLSDDGKRAVVSRTGVVTVVDLVAGRTRPVKPPVGVTMSGVPHGVISGDGKTIAFGVRSRTGEWAVAVRDFDREEYRALLECAHYGPIRCVLSRDGNLLVTHLAAVPVVVGVKSAKDQTRDAKDAANDLNRSAQVWSVDLGKELFKAKVSGREGLVTSVAISADADFLAVSAGDGPIDLWDVTTGLLWQTLLGRKEQGARVAISPDGKTIASIATDYHVQRWKSDGTPLGISEPPVDVVRAKVTALKFLDNERLVAWATAGQFAVAWEMPAGKRLTPRMDHSAPVQSIVFPVDAKREMDPITSGLDGKILRWDLVNGAITEEINLRPVHLPGEQLKRPIVALSSDGRWGLETRPLLEVFDLATGEDKYCIPPPTSQTAPASFSLFPYVPRVISLSLPAPGRPNGLGAVWDLAQQRRVSEFEIPGVSVANAPLFGSSPDGKWIVATIVMKDENGKLYPSYQTIEVETGKLLPPVEDRTSAGTIKYAVANDRTLLVTSTVGRVWTVDLANGVVGDDIFKTAPQGEPPFTGPIRFSTDGKLAAIAAIHEPYKSYGVHVFDWPARKLLHTYVGHLGPVSSLQFSPDDTALVSGSQDTSVIVWDLAPVKKAARGDRK